MLVLRDVEEDEHLETLDKAARANLEALWRDVDKPSRCEIGPNALSPLATHAARTAVGCCPSVVPACARQIPWHCKPGARHCCVHRE